MYCKKQHLKSVFSETRVSDEFKWFPAKKQALISDKTDFSNRIKRGKHAIKILPIQAINFINNLCNIFCTTLNFKFLLKNDLKFNL